MNELSHGTGHEMRKNRMEVRVTRIYGGLDSGLAKLRYEEAIWWIRGGGVIEIYSVQSLQLKLDLTIR